MGNEKKWDGAVVLPTEVLIPDPANPNEMSKETFESLVEMIRERGFDEPLQVVENPEKKGTYLIVGGEHRWKAARILGLEQLPCVVWSDLSEEDRRMLMVRRNVVKGDLDRVKFSKLVKAICDKLECQPEELQGKFGFTSETEYLKLLKEKENKEKKALDEADKAKRTVQLADNLSYVVGEILSKYGDTIPNGWI